MSDVGGRKIGEDFVEIDKKTLGKALHTIAHVASSSMDIELTPRQKSHSEKIIQSRANQEMGGKKVLGKFTAAALGLDEGSHSY